MKQDHVIRAGDNDKVVSVKAPEVIKHVVVVRAISIVDHGNGLFSIELPSRLITESESEALSSLFPNLRHKTEELLDQEALLQSLATEADLTPKPSQSDIYKASKKPNW